VWPLAVVVIVRVQCLSVVQYYCTVAEIFDFWDFQQSSSSCVCVLPPKETHHEVGCFHETREKFKSDAACSGCSEITGRGLLGRRLLVEEEPQLSVSNMNLVVLWLDKAPRSFFRSSSSRTLVTLMHEAMMDDSKRWWDDWVDQFDSMTQREDPTCGITRSNTMRWIP